MTRSSDTTASPATLSDLGITQNQSSQWQKLAAVPEPEFEAALAAPGKPTTRREGGDVFLLTTAGLGRRLSPLVVSH
jgi:hypothetical protein